MGDAQRDRANLPQDRNETTAESHTSQGQAVEVSFWLADPPAVSHFSVHYPGLQDDDFSDQPPLVICAEGAFVLFCVTLNVPEWRSIHHFVYSAGGPAGSPSLRLLPVPDPEVEAFESQQFGLLPCGGQHYAVVFLDRNWISSDEVWEYHAYLYSSKTRAWSTTKVSLPHLSEAEKVLFDRHASCKQITVGPDSLGWVDLLCGILLLCNLFDGNPVIKYIPFPATRVCITDKDGVADIAAEHLCDVTCCGDLIKFVQIDFDEPDFGSSGNAWKATTWNRKLTWDDWRNRCTIDVAQISVHTSYSAILPELLDNETQQLQLKDLIFINPTLSMQDDNRLYIMAKVNDEDDKAWVLAVDMKHAALEALVPVSTERFYTVMMYSPCAFPKYLNNLTAASPRSGHPERVLLKKPACISVDRSGTTAEYRTSHVIKHTADPAPCVGNPNWVLLNKIARISQDQNETTAKCHMRDGQAVEVSFWLVDPPGISHFSVHCPGLEENDFSGELPFVICAEAAFVLFSVTLNVPDLRSIYHFVYTARGSAGKPSLHLIPDPKPEVAAFRTQHLGLLPCGDEHYAVAFLHREWKSRDKTWQYYAYVFSSKTLAWRRSKAALLHLTESDQILLDRHDSCKQIAVGGCSLGWVDLSYGILLVCNLFDEHPVIKYIPFPVPTVCITDNDKDDIACNATKYFCDVTCSDDLIKCVEVELGEPDCRSNGKAWKATTWNRKVSWEDWHKCCTVDAAKISVDRSYYALLTELLDDETQQLELKKLIFLMPTLSMQDDDLLYMMVMVKNKDGLAWVIAVDMKHAALKALVPAHNVPSYTVTLYCPCAFPKYLKNMIPGADMADRVGKHFKRHRK